MKAVHSFKLKLWALKAGRHIYVVLLWYLAVNLLAALLILPVDGGGALYFAIFIFLASIALVIAKSRTMIFLGIIGLILGILAILEYAAS
jgi:hypothetical protein